MNEEIQIFTRWVDPTIDDFKMALEEANKQIEEDNKEIERLTELCNKYEEEHKTTFETWQKDIKENKQLHSIIKEVREYMGNYSFIDDIRIMDYKEYQELLEILDKAEENK